MLFISKAQEISRLQEQYAGNMIDKKDYEERLSAILYASYRPFKSGVSVEQEKQLLWNLVVDDVINNRDYEEQVSKIKRAAMYGQGERHWVQQPVQYPQASYPSLKKKKGYVAPIVWIFIGLICFHSFWLIPLGVIIIILALIGLSCRVSYNNRAEVENKETMMRYGVRYSY